MAKDQFQATEDLIIYLGPHINKLDGTEITGDTLTLTVVAPNGDVLTNPTHFANPTQDANTNLWKIILPVALLTGPRNIAPFLWQLKSVSSNANALNQRKVYTWGDYVNDITAAKTAAVSADGKGTTILDERLGVSQYDPPHTLFEDVEDMQGDVASIGAKTANLPAVPAAQGDVTALGADIAAIKAKTDVPAELASADAVATVQGSVTAVQTTVNLLKKYAEGRWKIIGTQLVLYDTDNMTVIFRFQLYNADGVESATQIYERVPL